MAKEPQDRDETRRSGAPDEGADPRPGARRATNDDPSSLPEENFLLDLGAEAPRVQSSAEDDASEEWILVEDDLLAAAEADAAGAQKGASKTPSADLKPDDEAVRLIEEMKDIAADVSPVNAFDENGSSAARAADIEAEQGVVAPIDGDGERRDAAEMPAAISAPPFAPAPVLTPTEPEPEAPKVQRRPKSRAAAIAIAASLVAGCWFGVQYYRSHTQAATEVANVPTVEKPVPTPAPKPPKPTPKKPEIENARPPDPQPVATVKEPTPDPKPAPVPTPAKGETLPVIPVDPTPDPTAAGAPLPKPVVTDPNAKAAAPKASPNIVDTKIPIRPAKPLDPKAAKTTTGTKKNDTIVELKNGYTLRGRIKRVKDDQLTLGVPGGEFTFGMNDVKVLDSSAPEYLTEADMPAISIVLKGGQRMRGKLLKQDADHVVMVVEHGQIVVDRVDIREVSFTGRIHF